MGQIGSIGMSLSLGATAGVGSTLGAGATSAGSASQTPAGGLQAGQTMSASTSVQALSETLQDFSSAEILMALMLMAASQKKDEDSGGGSAAMGLIAGLMMAGQFGQQANQQISANISIPEGGIAGGIGIQLDLQV